ncbi:type II toxin-antitoxin system VapC family toxin [soil metagenome]
MSAPIPLREPELGRVRRLVLDTSVLVDHLRGDSCATSMLIAAARAGHELWSVSIVRTEVLSGVRRGEEAATRELLDHLQWLDITVEVADRAGELAGRHLRTHPGVDTTDYLVAAATQLLDAELRTLNVRHFPMFPGLQPAY